MSSDDSKERAGAESEHVEQSAAFSDDVGSSTLDAGIIRSSWRDNKKFILIACVVNIANLDYGLDTGMINGFQAMPGFLQVFGYADPQQPGGYAIRTIVQQLITSLVSVGMMISSLLAGPVIQCIGRKGGLWLGCALMFVSVTMQMLVTDHGGLYASRIILGLGCGFLLTSSQLYMQEISPANLRSFNFSLYITWVSIGSLIGSVVNNYCTKILSRTAYRIPLGIIYAVTFIYAVVIVPLPESPRHLAVKGKKEQAYRSLRWLRDAAYTDQQVERELCEIENSIEMDSEGNSSVGFLDIFRGGNLRRTLISVAVATFPGASGSQFIIQYGVYFFVVSGNGDPFQSTIIVLSMGLLGSLVSPLYTGWVGKRPILMIGSAVQGLCMLGMALVNSVRGLDTIASNTILAMTCIFMFTFCACINPFSWQIAAEVPTQALRAHTLGFATCVGFTSGFLLTFTVPYFINPTSLNWGPKYAYIWCPANFACTIFTFFFVPETNKRTLEEIDQCFAARVPIRKFPSYQAVDSITVRAQQAE